MDEGPQGLSINEEAYRQRFRATLKDTESYRELAVHAKGLSQQVDEGPQGLGGGSSGASGSGAIFASELPQDVHFYMQEKKPGTVLEAGQLVDEYFL